MRIAFIVHDYHKSGGHSRYVYELAMRFAAEHDVHVFANKIQGRDPRIAYHYVPALRFNALASVLTFILPATLLRLKRFDIVHAQGLCGLRQNVVTAHMCQTAWYRAQEKYMGALTLKQKIFRALVQPIEKYIFQSRRSKAVIAVSRRVKDDLRECYGRANGVTVIHHGVDLQAFTPENRFHWRVHTRTALGMSNDKFMALYVGDLQKGALPAIEAISRVEAARLVCVSPSNPEPYKVFAEKMGVTNRVHFVPRSDCIERYYAAADVFLFPTFYDTFGMVISEAMASGLPVITSALAGASELIDHEINGVLVADPWDAKALTAWLERLKSDIALRDNMGVEARRKIEHYSWDDTAAETMRVYRDVLDAKQSPGTPH